MASIEEVNQEMLGAAETIQQASVTTHGAESFLDDFERHITHALEGSQDPEADGLHQLIYGIRQKLAESYGYMDGARSTIEAVVARETGGPSVPMMTRPAATNPPTVAIINPHGPASLETQESRPNMPMISPGQAMTYLDIPRGGFYDEFRAGLPTLRYASGIARVPEEYVHALGASPEWRNRHSLVEAVEEFALTDTGRDIIGVTVDRFEGRIDDKLRKIGNAALTTSEAASLIGIDRKTVINWKRSPSVSGDELSLGEPVRPHVLFDMYSWRLPASYQHIGPINTNIENAPMPDMLKRHELADEFGLSVAGIQKVTDHLHTFALASGNANFFTADYIERLKRSNEWSARDSVLGAARKFSHQPEAARAIAAAEQGLRAEIRRQTDDDGEMLTEKLELVLGLGSRAIRKWQADGVLPVLPKTQRGEKPRIKSADINGLFSWRYPAEYPQA